MLLSASVRYRYEKRVQWFNSCIILMIIRKKGINVALLLIKDTDLKHAWLTKVTLNIFHFCFLKINGLT